MKNEIFFLFLSHQQPLYLMFHKPLRHWMLVSFVWATCFLLASQMFLQHVGWVGMCLGSLRLASNQSVFLEGFLHSVRKSLHIEFDSFKRIKIRNWAIIYPWFLKISGFLEIILQILLYLKKENERQVDQQTPANSIKKKMMNWLQVCHTVRSTVTRPVLVTEGTQTKRESKKETSGKTKQER